MKNLLILFIFLFFAQYSRAQTTFHKCYNYNWGDAGNYIQQTSDGGYVIAASHWGEYFVVKTDANGDTLWKKTYGITGNPYALIPTNIEPTSDGGYIIAGYPMWQGYPYLVKINSVGDTLSTKIFTYTCGVKEALQSLDGGYLITGVARVWCSQGGILTYLIKTNTNGDTLWSKYYYNCVGYGNGSVTAALTADSGYVLTGSSVVKTTKNGDTLWTRAYGNNSINAIEQTSDGGYIMGTSVNNGSYDFAVIKTNALGDTLWTKSYGDTKDEILKFVSQTSDGGYIFAGTTKSVAGDSTDIYIVKTNIAGDTLWTKVYGEPGVDDIYSIKQTADKGFIISAHAYFAGNFYIIKTDSMGNSLGCHEKRINTSVNFAPCTANNQVIATGNLRAEASTVNSHTGNSFLNAYDACTINVNVIKEINSAAAPSVFPNPATNTITLKYVSEIGLISIYNSMNQIVLQTKSKTTTAEIDISHLAAGIYVLSASGFYTRLIKE